MFVEEVCRRFETLEVFVDDSSKKPGSKISVRSSSGSSLGNGPRMFLVKGGASEDVSLSAQPESSLPNPAEPESQKTDLDPNLSTDLALQLDRLKLATLSAIRRRERLPQPLFWSLFHAEVGQIKKRREKRRRALAAAFDCDWL